MRSVGRRMSAAVASLALVASGAPLFGAVANAVEVPDDVSGAFSIQTNGPNGAIGLGDFYSASSAQGGGAQPHVLLINVPCSWPATTPINVDLYSPQINTATTGYAGNQTYEEPAGAGDTTSYTLTNPAGGTVTTTSYAPISSTTDSWVRFTTLSAPLTCGTYALSVTTSNDDQNGWKLRVGADDDSDPNNTPPTNSDNPDGLAGTDDELAVGVAQTSYQHDLGDGSPARARCLTLYEYVDPGKAAVTFHNFDLDNASLAGSGVRYYAPSAAYDPTGQTGGVAGTLSANASWNGGSTSTRSGDTLANPETGWWRLVTCLNNHNQFIQEGQTDQPAYFNQPPTPALQVSKDDGTTVVDPGQQVTYTVTVNNTSSGATAGAATGVVSRDTLPTGLAPVSCAITGATPGEACAFAGQVATATFAGAIPAGGSRSWTVVAQVAATPPATLTNSVSTSYQDSLGNPFTPIVATDVDTIGSADLSLTKTHSGSFTVSGSGSYTLTATNAAGSASRARGVQVVDALPAGLTYTGVTGAGWGCMAVGQTVTCTNPADLAPGASSSFTLSVAVGAGAFPGLTNTATVSSGTPDPVSANNTATDPTSVAGGSIGDTVFDDGNGSGLQDPGEPGLGGVTVTLQTGGSTVGSTLTDGSGHYSFTGLATGEYTVVVSTPVGHVPTSATSRTVSLTTPGQSDLGVDFGSRTPPNQPPAFTSASTNTAQTVAPGGGLTPVAATDPDSDPLTYTVTGGSLPAGVTLNANGTFTGTASTPGTTTVTITASDPSNASATTTLVVTVPPPANQPPVAQDDTATTTSGTPVATNVLANDTDPDVDPLVLSSVTQPAHGTVSCTAVGACTYTPAAGYTGVDSYTYIVSDGTLSDTGTVQVTVTAPPNAPPAFDSTTNNTAQSIPVGGTPLPLTATDPDGDPLTYSTPDPLPAGLTLNPNGTFTGTATTPGGPTTAVVTVSDTKGGTDTTTLALTVTAPPPPANGPPVAVNDTASTPTDTPVTTNVLANDTDPDPADSLAVVGHSTPTHGGVTCSATSCSFTPTTGYAGPDSYTYTVSDGTASATATVAVTVLDAPPAFDGSTSNTGQTMPVGTGPAPLSASDPNGDPLTFSTADPLPPGVTLRPDGTFAGAPTTPGTTTVTVTVSDGTLTDTTTVTFTVVPAPNRPPVAANDTGASAGVPVVVPVLSNDTDPDGDPLSVLSFGQPTHGTVGCALGGACTYTPDTGYSGPDTFTYTVTDGRGGTDSAAVTLTVTAVNDPPVAVADSGVTPEDTAVVIAVLANDSDPDGDPLTLASFTQPAQGTVACTAAGRCTYVPATNSNGPDAFTYTVTDSHGAPATTTVTLSVTPVNDPPVVTPDAATTAAGTPVTIDVLTGATDPDGDPVTVQSVTQPAHGTVSCTATGQCTYTPASGFSGPDTFTFTVTDGHTGTTTSTATVTVAAGPPVTPPVVTPPVMTPPVVTPSVVSNGGRPDQLPFTGADVRRASTWAFGLLALGLLLLVSGRRAAASRGGAR